MAGENNLWKSVRSRLVQSMMFVQRIETSTGEGVPDVWVGWDTGYTWLELKHTEDYPARESTRVFGAKGLRVEQVAWHVAASQRGIVAFILAGIGIGHNRQLFLVPSTEAENFNGMTKTELAMWRVSPDNLVSTLKVAGRVQVPPGQ